MKDSSNENDQGQNYPFNDPEESLPMLLSTCVKNMRDSLNNRFVQAGCSITSEQWRLLTMLATRDGISQQELARQCDRTEVSILNLLKKLEISGHVLRQRDPVDARCNRVFLTSSGRRQQKELLPVAQIHLAKVCDGIAAHDIDHLKAMLLTIVENIKKQ